MKCPYCKKDDNTVWFQGQSKEDKEGTPVRRKRKCKNCGRQFWTIEDYDEKTKRAAKRYNRMQDLRWYAGF